MTKRMLIDTTHPEETRVAVVSGNKLEEYDYETLVRKQLKSNIYLVKVTRVEPSLQAAFVDFGGNRHGFLPFPEIHPDYYRIPIADREALLAEEKALAEAQAAREDAEDEAELAARGENLEEEEEETPRDDDADDEEEDDNTELYKPRHAGSIAEEIAVDIVTDDDEDEDQDDTESEEQASEADAVSDETAEEDATAEADDNDKTESLLDPEAEAEPPTDPDVDVVGGDSAEPPVFRSAIKRRYKIQEVIKRNQIMLIQISKEERGNKGAAVTSYISLPGRYCVLMPNSPRGGGVSRKVSNAKDRQRLKKILIELNVPEGMSVILRTAGVTRSKAEIKRDLDYLLRLWDEIRELTLKSTAPALIYEEGNLIKRSIRDLYRRDIEEVHVAGEEGYKTAHDFMQTLMPSHASRVQSYQDESMPLFFRYQVEKQIDEIHNPTVHLKSGGYIVINPTEALVSIDVNSGKATKGRHIEETALKTNIEAAEEIARQLRLRDLGGLVVIDFIDMEDRRGNRTVEKKMRDAMAGDRARIQLGRISAFGLMELSRQRLNPSLVETNFEICAHCTGVGVIRTVETTAVMILRAIEEEGLRAKSSEIRVHLPSEIALYVLNHKRAMITVLEKRYGLRVLLLADETLMKPHYKIESSRKSGQHDNHVKRQAPVQTVDMSDLPVLPEEEMDDLSTVSEENQRENEGDTSRDGRSRGGRGRGGRSKNTRSRGSRGGRKAPQTRNADSADGTQNGAQGPAVEGTQAEGDQEQTPRRRGRRGGRRRGGRGRNNRGPRTDNNSGETDGGAPHAQPAKAVAQGGGAPQDNTPTATGGGEAAAGGGTARKGWWKRLTE